MRLIYDVLLFNNEEHGVGGMTKMTRWGRLDTSFNICMKIRAKGYYHCRRCCEDLSRTHEERVDEWLLYCTVLYCIVLVMRTYIKLP